MDSRIEMQKSLDYQNEISACRAQKRRARLVLSARHRRVSAPYFAAQMLALRPRALARRRRMFGFCARRHRAVGRARRCRWFARVLPLANWPRKPCARKPIWTSRATRTRKNAQRANAENAIGATAGATRVASISTGFAAPIRSSTAPPAKPFRAPTLRARTARAPMRRAPMRRAVAIRAGKLCSKVP